MTTARLFFNLKTESIRKKNDAEKKCQAEKIYRLAIGLYNHTILLWDLKNDCEIKVF